MLGAASAQVAKDHAPLLTRSWEDTDDRSISRPMTRRQVAACGPALSTADFAAAAKPEEGEEKDSNVHPPTSPSFLRPTLSTVTMAHVFAAQAAAAAPPSVPQKQAKTPQLLYAPRIRVANTSSRRMLINGLIGLSLTTSLYCESANAAARRPPPPPPTEKNDPNISGVQAKVLASKKRKEAMKEAMAKLREKGKLVDNEKPQE